MPYYNFFSRWQARRIQAAADQVVFITENEKRNLELLLNEPTRGEVIYNIVTPVEHDVVPFADVAADDRFKVAVLSNYSWVRGIDRLIAVAEALKRLARDDIAFVVAGDMGMKSTLPGDLRPFGRRGDKLDDYARHRGVADWFRFLGHVRDPERVLAGADLLAKPTREANPWGRDILEALGAGKPVISVGTYDRFVETGVTGVLTPEFDADTWAREIAALADDPNRAARLGRNAAARIAELCDGPARARDLLDVWRRAAA